MPKVTVVIPNYNHARFLDQRIQSVLNQTHSNFELIYLDDASTDNSNEVFSQYADDLRVRPIINQMNSGSPFPQWNKGVREAKGEYIWIAEADDYADDTLLEKLVLLLDQNPNVGIAYCSSWSVDETGEKHGCSADWLTHLDPERWRTDFVSDGRDECRRFMVLANTIPNASAVVFRRDVYLAMGGADEDMRYGGDWLLWAKMLFHADIAYIAQPMNYFRFHAGSVGSKSLNNGINAEESYRIAEYILSQGEVSKETMEKARNYLADRWVPSLVSKHRSIPRERNAQIYRIATRLDPDLKPRVAKKIAARAMNKISRIVGLGTPSSQ